MGGWGGALGFRGDFVLFGFGIRIGLPFSRREDSGYSLESAIEISSRHEEVNGLAAPIGLETEVADDVALDAGLSVMEAVAALLVKAQSRLKIGHHFLPLTSPEATSWA